MIPKIEVGISQQGCTTHCFTVDFVWSHPCASMDGVTCQWALTDVMCRIDEHTLLWRIDEEVRGEGQPVFKLHYSRAGTLGLTGRH